MENNYCGICKHIQYRLYTCPNCDTTMCEYCSNYINNEKYCEDCYFKNAVIGKCFQCEQKSSLFINNLCFYCYTHVCEECFNNNFFQLKDNIGICQKCCNHEKEEQIGR